MRLRRARDVSANDLRIHEWAAERPGGPRLYDIMKRDDAYDVVAQFPRRGQAKRFIQIWRISGRVMAKRYEQMIWRRYIAFHDRQRLRR